MESPIREKRLAAGVWAATMRDQLCAVSATIAGVSARAVEIFSIVLYGPEVSKAVSSTSELTAFCFPDLSRAEVTRTDRLTQISELLTACVAQFIGGIRRPRKRGVVDTGIELR